MLDVLLGVFAVAVMFAIPVSFIAACVEAGRG
jgi:hypothetical protein